MPWHEVGPMDQRLEMMREYALGLDSMAELAERYGVTAKTGFKWLQRYRALGAAGLLERSRRPHGNARAFAADTRQLLIAARRAHPTWGADKLLPWVAARTPTVRLPKRATVCDLLRREQLVVRRRRARRAATSGGALTAPAQPNALWTIDFKGQFRVGDGTVCYPLTLRDAASRFLLRCESCRAPETHVTRARCEAAFREFGLPDAMGSDNGSPFGSTGLRRLSRLAVWWIRLGIAIVRIRPGHPEDNGSHEQFHRVLKAETARPPARTVAAQQRRFAAFRREYNEDRPHAAHGQRPPTALYTPSRRPFPRRLPAVDYPGHYEVRRVTTNGCVKWQGQVVYLTEVLVDQPIGWEETDDDLWTVYFGSLVLGTFDGATKCFVPAGGV
jgi:transposase InsO family protein